MLAGDDEEVVLGSVRWPGGRRRIAIAGLAGSILAVVALVAVTSDGGSSVESPSATAVTRPASVITVPTPSSVLEVDPGSMTRQPTGVVLLGSNQRYTHRLDLVTGVLEGLEPPLTPFAVVDGGAMVVSGTVAWRPDPLDAEGSLTLGPAEQVVDTGLGTAWLVRTAAGGRLDGLLVDVRTNEMAGSIDAPPGTVAVAGTDRGLMVEAAGGLYMLTGDDGTSSRVTTGEVTATAPGLVLYRTCDDGLRCEHRLRVLADGSEVGVSLPGDGGRAYLAPGGAVILAERSDPTGGTVLDVVITGGSERGVIVRVDTPPGLSRSALDRLAWSPDGQFAVVPLDEVLLLVSAGGAATLVPLPDGLPVELVTVLSPG